MKSRLLLASFLGLMMTVSLGCPPRDVQPDEPDVDVDVDQATIESRLESEIGPIANATINVYRVGPNGAMQNITLGTPTSDAQGAFAVAIDMTGGPFMNLIVEATPTDVQEGQEEMEGLERGRVLVVREISSGDTLTISPINYETTVAADVYVQARMAGEWDDRCDTPTLRLLITPGIAGSVATGDDYTGDVEVLARSTTAGMKAYMSTLLAERERLRGLEERDDDTVEGAEPVDTFDDDDLQSARDALRSAFDDYEERIFGTTDMEDRMEARIELYHSWIDAYSNNNVGLHLQGRAAHSLAEAQMIYFDELGDAAQARAMADNEFFRALRVTSAIEENADRMGVTGEPHAAIEQASNSLMNSLLALGEGSGDISGAIQENWSNYQTTVETQLEQELDSDQFNAYVQYRQSVMADRGQLLEAFEGLQPNMTSSAVANTTVESVPAFYNQTVTAQRIENLEEVGFSEDGAHAMLENLFHFSIVTGDVEMD